MAASCASAREAATWETRLLAGLIAAPVFELSLLLSSVMLSRGSPAGAIYLLLHTPLLTHGVLCAVPTAAGAIWGMGGLAWLLGHLFWTHPLPQRQVWLTGLAWLALAALPCLVTGLS